MEVLCNAGADPRKAYGPKSGCTTGLYLAITSGSVPLVRYLWEE